MVSMVVCWSLSARVSSEASCPLYISAETGAAEAIGVTGYRVGAAEVVDEGAVADSEEVAVALVFSACMSASDMPMGA